MVTTHSTHYGSFRRSAGSLTLALAVWGALGATNPGAARGQSSGARPLVSGPAPTFGLNDVQLAPGETIVDYGLAPGEGAIHHGGNSYQLISPDAVPHALGDGSGQSPLISGSPMSAGMGGCATGRCGMHAGTGAYGGGGISCPTCEPYGYGSLEGLYMKQTEVDRFSYSPNFALNDFDYEFGIRATMGLVPDCRNGMEVSFTGPFEWASEARAANPAGGIGTFLTPALPFVAGTLSTFSDAVAQAQRFEAEYFSFEFNRTMIGWEICKLLYGLRYVDYQEDFLYASRIASGQEGSLISSVDNRMIGIQLGAEMTYPITCRLWSDFRGRAGVYANFAESSLRVDNAGALVQRVNDDDVELAGVFELGGGLRFYFNDDFFLRIGTEFWYLSGVASANDQFGFQLRPASGRSINIDDDVIMVGLSFGGEVKF